MKLRSLRNLTCLLVAGTTSLSCVDAGDLADAADSTETVARNGKCPTLELVEEDTEIAAGECFRVEGSLDIRTATLTVESGGVLELGQGAVLRVGSESKLLALGTESSPAVVRGSSDEAGFWGSIEVAAGGTLTSSLPKS